MSISGLLSGSVQGSLGISAGAAIAVGTNIERVAAHITGATVEVGRDLRLDADLLMVQGNLAVGGSLADSFAL